ncbi:MAG: hypothetical protein U1E53_08255 [Dongiaceae bacterium]
MLEPLLDLVARGAGAAASLLGRGGLPETAAVLRHDLAERSRALQALAAGDPGCREAGTLERAVAQLDMLVRGCLQVCAPAPVAAFATQALLEGLDGTGPLPPGKLPPDAVARLIDALVAALAEAGAELDAEDRARLAGIVAALEGLVTMIRTQGVRLTVSALDGYLEPILIRLLQLCDRGLPTPLISRLWCPALALLDGLPKVGAGPAAVAPLLVKLLVAAAGLAIGNLIGWLILKLPVGGGRTLWNAMEASPVSDAFWWIDREATGLDDCEALYAAYLRSRELRRAAQRTGADRQRVAVAAAAEIALLERYVPCLPESGRVPFQRKLQQLRALLAA